MTLPKHITGHGPGADEAFERGYTRDVFCTGAWEELQLLISPGADLEGSFTAYDYLNNEWLTVKGWLCEINDLDEVSDFVGEPA